MTNIYLSRFWEVESKPTFGKLIIGGLPRYSTLELPWINNQRSISCIPSGSYICKATKNRRTLGGMDIPRTFEVMNVPDRSGILFHVGNYQEDTNGCILVGTDYGTNDERCLVTSSRIAFARFMGQLIRLDTFNLHIGVVKYDPGI